MEATNLIHYYFNLFFLIYGGALFISYILIGTLSSFELNSYTKRNKFFNFKTVSGYKVLPSVSIIAPAYNEARTIIENIRSLLSLSYPNLEVIVVNDGSSDDSLELVLEHYQLVRVTYAFEPRLETAQIRGIYKSTNVAYANLVFIDKENGGKADALNAGINVARSQLFLAIDVDCILEHDAILRMVKPFLEEDGSNKRVIASGGVIRVANSCKVEDGRITRVHIPRNLLAKFQVLEYLRAFTMGRMAWSRVNGLLIISGAFGLFDRGLVLDIGGYDTTSVGEDLELVVRMRKYMHAVLHESYKVAFIPDPLCWTEVPTSLRVLSRQRNRWMRGLIDTLVKHRDMMFNPKYGRIGLLSFPYWVFFEWLAPIFEVIGVSYFTVMAILGRVNMSYFILFSLLVFSFALLYSSFAVFYEMFLYGRYRGVRMLLQILGIALLEMLFYHPLNVIFAISGNYSYFVKHDRKGWGRMVRVGFNANNNDDGK